MQSTHPVCETFAILLPQNIPLITKMTPGIRGEVRDLCFSLCREAPEMRPNLAIAAQLEAVLRCSQLLALQDIPASLNQEDSAHDAYFLVKRVAGEDPLVFVRMVLWARWMLMLDIDESPFSLPISRLAVLDKSLTDLLLSLLGETSAGDAPRVKWSSRGSEYSSMTRWLRGHQIFAALTQGLVFSFQALSWAVHAESQPDIASAGRLTVSLLNGSAAALEFTGDFPATDYNDLIRPSMKPPLVPETFSGLLAVDHRFLVGLMRAMKSTLDTIRLRDAALHQRLAQALNSVYESHKFVCDRFVGTLPSLLMEANPAKSGVEQLQRFQTNRMKVFEKTRSKPTAPQ